jgi:hypothetical protein
MTREAMSLVAIVVFPGRFHGVGGQEQVALPGQLHAPLKGPGRAGVDGVGEKGRAQARLAGHLVGQFPCGVQGLVGCLEFQVGAVENPLADDGPHARCVGRFGHGAGKEIGIAKAGRARGEHLGAGEQGAQTHGLGREPGLGRPDVVGQPGGQGRVVAQSAKKRHGRVGVGVAESGQNQSLAEVQTGTRLVACGQVGRRAEVRDAAVGDGQGGFAQDVAGVVLAGEDRGRQQGVAGDGLVGHGASRSPIAFRDKSGLTRWAQGSIRIR